MTDLSMESAQGMVATQPLEVSQVRQDLAEVHAEAPQRAMLADLALRKVEEGLQELRSLGHTFHLLEGTPPSADEFPKMLYRDDPSGTDAQLIVHAAWEEQDARAQGWDDHPSLRQAPQPPASEAPQPAVAPLAPASLSSDLPDGQQAPQPDQNPQPQENQPTGDQPQG